MMIQRKIYSTGESIPVVGLGTWRVLDISPSDTAGMQRREQVIRAFFELGGRVIDTSPMYGHSEEVTGILLNKTGLSDRCFYATKVWTTGAESGARQIEDSFRLLQTPVIDLFQVHNLVDLKTQMRQLMKLKESGRVRMVGVTHYLTSQFEAIAEAMKNYPLDFIQIPFSIALRDAEERILPLAMKNKVAVIVNRPFEGGSLFADLRKKDLPPLGSELGCKSWAQFFLKYIISHPAVTCVIPATSHPDHLKENMQAGMSGTPIDQRMRLRMLNVMSKV